MKVVVCVLAMLFPMSASGQTVFFDDFEGNALLPHWEQPPPSHWEYQVANSRLTVTGLFYPSSPPYHTNWASISATYAPQADFVAEARMGWEQGVGLFFGVLGTTASISYIDGVVVMAQVGGELAGVHALPPPGVQQFTITRTGAQFEFYLNGHLFGSFTNGPTTLAEGVGFGFNDFPGAAGPFYVDRVMVTPSPSVFGVAVVGLAWLRRRRVRSAA